MMINVPKQDISSTFMQFIKFSIIFLSQKRIYCYRTSNDLILYRNKSKECINFTAYSVFNKYVLRYCYRFIYDGTNVSRVSIVPS